MFCSRYLSLIALALFVILGGSIVYSQEKVVEKTPVKVKEVLDNLKNDVGHFPSLADYFPSKTANEYLCSDSDETAKALLYGVENDYWKDNETKKAAIAILQRMRKPFCYKFFKEYYLKKDDGPPKVWRYFYFNATFEMSNFLVDVARNGKDIKHRREALLALLKNDHLAESSEIQTLIYQWLTEQEYNLEKERYLREDELDKYFGLRISTETFRKIFNLAAKHRKNEDKVSQYLRFVSTRTFGMRWGKFENIVREYLKQQHKDTETLKSEFERLYWQW